MKKFIQEHPELRKLLGLFYFLVKIVFFTGIFTILRIFLLNDKEKRTPSSDHHPEGDIPNIQETRTRNPSISGGQAEQTLQEMFEGVLDETFPIHQSANDENNNTIQNKIPITQAPDVAQQHLERICGYYDDICNKTLREGEFSIHERLFYQGVLIYLLTEIDNRYQESGGVHNAPSRSQTTGREIISYLKVHKDPEARRGSAGHTFLKVNEAAINSRNEFWQIATHEYGHIFDLGVLKGNSSLINKLFTEFGKAKWAIDDPSLDFYRISWDSENARKATASRNDFVSGYAMKSAYEDFAESFNLYMNHYAYFQTLAESNTILAEKFSFLEKFFTQGLFDDGITQDIPSSGSRVWDTTKIGN